MIFLIFCFSVGWDFCHFLKTVSVLFVFFFSVSRTLHRLLVKQTLQHEHTTNLHRRIVGVEDQHDDKCGPPFVVTALVQRVMTAFFTFVLFPSSFGSSSPLFFFFFYPGVVRANRSRPSSLILVGKNGRRTCQRP